ncbi:unnamed protein product [Ophioblennius macclurei]
MSGMSGDQLHRSTLGVYSSLLDEFNPSLHKLVLLGSSYVQAFRALALASESYFSALSRIGEKAFHTGTSRPLGEVLLQICENQRRLTTELDGVFRRFNLEVLQEMDRNIEMDIGYIAGSRDQYMAEAQKQAAVLEMQRRRGSRMDGSEHVQFLRESHVEALQEEERRYRFVAEKHCGLIQSFAHLMNKTGGTLTQKADAWMDNIGATRQPEARRPAAQDNASRMKQSRDEPLGKIPSRAPSPQEGVRSRAGSMGGGGGGGGAGRTMRAKAAYQPPGSNTTLLPFGRGQIIYVMVQQPRNGWLFGRLENNSRQGWFPASYVVGVDEPDGSPSLSHSSLRSSNVSNVSNFDQLRMSNNYATAKAPSSSTPAPAPPPLPTLEVLAAMEKSSASPSAAPTSDRRPQSKPENQRQESHGSRPELFPRGTNPFATVKLKPTKTDDRSAPRLYRR